MWSLLKWERRKADRLLPLVHKNGRPKRDQISEVAKSVRLIELNIKAFGYDLARRMTEALPPVPQDGVARHVGLHCQASTQADIESDWAAHWAGQLRIGVVYHRKIWELAYVLQAIHEHGHMVPGAKGLGFGCGVEPVPSYLASRGVAVTVTDLDHADAKAKGWIDTNQHARSLEQAFHPHLVERAVFDRLVDQRIADMNAIPETLQGYDFCWSMCAVEHLGSIQKGLDFLENSLKTLRPGGLSVHTLEYNVEADGPTVDNWVTVLFQRQHLEALAERLRAQGHEVAPFDFDMGQQPMDNFVDLPPWYHDMPEEEARRLGTPMHLKLGIDGFVATCFGIIIRKAA
jgi:2-polyprenyl-3-methyl-5-hydroxy-6-metoxy-1,4-benzoquinol methylase